MLTKNTRRDSSRRVVYVCLTRIITGGILSYHSVRLKLQPYKEATVLDLILQISGGLLYLAAKVFFFVSELEKSDTKKRNFTFVAWASYTIGLPIIVVFFMINSNWIAAFLEAAAAPAMVLGLLNTWKNQARSYTWIDWFFRLMIPAGFIVSIVDNGGLRTINQISEVGIVVGFLAGTWFLARKKPTGYLWLAFMNLSCGYLMYRQEKLLMVVQQALSVLFVLGAYYKSRLKRHADT